MNTIGSTRVLWGIVITGLAILFMTGESAASGSVRLANRSMQITPRTSPRCMAPPCMPPMPWSGVPTVVIIGPPPPPFIPMGCPQCGPMIPMMPAPTFPTQAAPWGPPVNWCGGTNPAIPVFVLTTGQDMAEVPEFDEEEDIRFEPVVYGGSTPHRSHKPPPVVENNDVTHQETRSDEIIHKLKDAESQENDNSPLLNSKRGVEILLQDAESTLRVQRFNEAERKACAAANESLATPEQQGNAWVIAGIAAYMTGNVLKTKDYFRRAAEACPNAIPNSNLMSTELWNLYQEARQKDANR